MAKKSQSNQKRRANSQNHEQRRVRSQQFIFIALGGVVILSMVCTLFINLR